MNEESGYTLIEVVIALLILSVVMLGLAGTTGALLVQAAEDDHKATAVELVHDRTEAVLTDPDYDNLQANYGGAETNLPGNPDFKRITTVTPMTVEGYGAIDAKKVSVKVTGKGLRKPVKRTVVRGRGQ